MADQTDFERMKDLLKEKILQRLPEPGLFETAIPGLSFFRRDILVEKEKCFFSPVIAVVLQGRKRSIIGNEEYHYGEGDCFITGMDLPAVTSVTKASAKSPLISFGIKLDRYLIAELLAEMGNNSGAVKDNPRTAVSVARVEQSVLDAFIRLINLLETPEQIPILSPLIMREIHYRLLIGPQGGILYTVSALGTPRNRIAEAITWLRENYITPFHVESLAERVNMSLPTFNRYFRQATTLSPIQFQKRLRLCEAQRLMAAGTEDATRAALTVGYESITQFNREYKRLFGEPPHRDANKKRVAV